MRMPFSAMDSNGMSKKDRLCDNCRTIDVRQMLLDCKNAYETQHRSATDAASNLQRDRARFKPNRFLKRHGVGQVSQFTQHPGCILCQVFCDTADRNGLYDRLFTFQLYMGIATQGTSYNPAIRHGPREQWRGSHASELEIYADPGSLPADDHALVGCGVGPDPASALCADLIQRWRSNCQSHHPKCKIVESKPPKLPKRVVDVSDSDAPRIVSTCGHSGFWVALSYCWGEESDFQLNSQTRRDFEAGVSLSKWPATLRDAVLITKQQGARYLWIDALCIMQDSTEDWKTEAAKMYEVYHHALFTIVAAGSSNVTSGILNARVPVKPLAKLPWRHPDGVQRHVHLRLPSMGGTQDTALLESPIYARAWTMQESLLSRRLLIYTQSQIIWSCESCEIDEKGRTYEPCLSPHFPFDGLTPGGVASSFLSTLNPNFDSSDGSVKQSMGLWAYWQFEIIHEYGRRRCTFESDTLIALSGIARAFHNLTGDVYLAGLWRKALVPLLTWSRWPIGRPNPANILSGSSTSKVTSKSRDTGDLSEVESWESREQRLESANDDAYHYLTHRTLQRSYSVGSGLQLYGAHQNLRGYASKQTSEFHPEDMVDNGSGYSSEEYPEEDIVDNGCGYDREGQAFLSQFIPNLEARDCLVNDVSRTAQYIAPTWSWASIKGDRILHGCYADLHTEIQSCAVEDVKVMHDSSGPFGSVKDGRLTIRAPMRRIPHADNGELDHIDFDPVARPLHEFIAEVEDEEYGRPGWVHSFEFVQQHQPCENQRFFLVQIMHCRVMQKQDDEDVDFLEKLTRVSEKRIFLLVESTPVPGIYRRVGLREIVLRGGEYSCKLPEEQTKERKKLKKKNRPPNKATNSFMSKKKKKRKKSKNKAPPLETYQIWSENAFTPDFENETALMAFASVDRWTKKTITIV